MSDQRSAADTAIDAAATLVDAGLSNLAEMSRKDNKTSVERLDRHQVVAYDLAHAASAIEASRVMADYGEHGDFERMLAHAFIADAIADVGARVLGRDAAWGVDTSDLGLALPFVAAHRAPEFLERLGGAGADAR